MWTLRLSLSGRREKRQHVWNPQLLSRLMTKVLTRSLTLQKRGLFRMSFSSLVSIAFTIRLCRRPTMKLVTIPAVKHEQVSDTELWPVPRQSKGKAPARLESPVAVSSDEPEYDQLSDTPKAKGCPSGTIAKALKHEQYLLRIYSCFHYG